MVPSLEALLAGLVDYAGLFPPAGLPMPEALAHYARYRREPEAWLLGRFVCPAARLAELPPPDDEQFQHGPPWMIAALGRGGATTSDFLDNLKLDLEAIETFRDRQEERCIVDVLEVKLPAEVGGATHEDAARALLLSTAEVIYEAQRPTLRAVFYEASAGADSRDATAALTAALAEDRTLGTHGKHWVSGLKLRCGGLPGPSPYPSAEQVAFTLTLCRDAGVPLKATAGLHHPLPTLDAAGQRQHGFLNLFAAGVLAHARRLGEDQVRQILAEENASQFVFDAAGLHWRGVSATAEEVAAAREKAVLSFGSCSFEEPCDGLRALGLLE
jgi:hypothetical protein